jgi:hypothetical protein
MPEELTDKEKLIEAANLIERSGATATAGPWWSDGSDADASSDLRFPYRLHGVHAVMPGQGDWLPAQVINHQILKAPRTGTTYAEYWPSAHDDRWLTMMSPVIAKPLSRWLEQEARRKTPSPHAIALSELVIAFHARQGAAPTAEEVPDADRAF